MWIQCTRLRHFQHVTSIMWEVPLISASDFRLSQQSTYSCVWFLRWLIPLAVSALPGRYIGQDVLRPRPPSIRPGCILALGWDEMGVTTSSFMLCFRLERKPCAQSQQVQCPLWESAAGVIERMAGGAPPLLHGQKPSFVLIVTHMLKVVGNLEWHYISPGSDKAVTTSLMNLSQSFNNAAIYRLGLYWIDCRSCTKARSVSAMKL